MNIYFLGMLCPIDRLNEIKSKSNYFDYPGNIFQNAVIKGLDELSRVTIITAPNIKNFKGRIFKASKFRHNGISSDICLPEFDLPGLKEIISAWNFRKELRKTQNVDAIIIYSTSFPALYAASHLKKREPHIKIINIITDLPEYMSSGNNFIYNTLKSIGTKLYNLYSRHIDGYVLLAPKMIEKLPNKDIPWMQFEGVYSGASRIKNNSTINDKTILYSGALEAKYGIINLLDAFEMIDDKEYKLYLCGTGNTVETIKQRATNDPRIQYLGELSHSKVLDLQSQVSLLINPRPSKDEYTMYSFPSKTIEYMASGTPVLMTKLKCLPTEYYQYLYFIETETPKGIRDKIVEFFKIPELERKDVGRRAADYILKNKTSSVQAKRILDFIENLNNYVNFQRQNSADYRWNR